MSLPFLVVGATARDIVLVHGFDASIERGTRDIDFGIQVKDWSQFEQLKSSLIENGFTSAKKQVHQLNIIDSDGLPWEIDIIPFGAVSDERQSIAWPPENVIEMSVVGFEEAMTNALQVTISESLNLQLNVASPAGMLLLKLNSWLEREDSIRKKDASDVFYLTKHYSKIPEILDALYDEGYMEAQNYHEHLAGTMKLADDAKNIAAIKTIKTLNTKLFSNEEQMDKFILDISRTMQVDYESAAEIVEIIKLRMDG
ncbi:nucleotidyl transferase AbiEii/AbiGii toxin family protein [Shewanella sp. 202IG2-18]|uniref:nucleotidyl transferase AbiEii/AbiGii toxin family protein n=1 Tax=Parashewanella hymeniacidonis TaxID=2807618 RepID=UPI00195FA1FA|nr:nucleotidyl transferase AbiEii/AbiGii toxin family protein [Parashewanella hymeniacidonis]MBM7070697.1 nucleotidyl transferase AbiEii/AbiGii toxin family protein [Parashewanella hymeniacidonis]